MLNEKIRDWLRVRVKPTSRETWQRTAGTLATVLLAFGLTESIAALWARLAIATVTLLFAYLYADTPRRAALYLFVAAVGGVVNAYGIAHHVNWALIVTAAGQSLGVLTAAAKINPAVNPGEPADPPLL